MSIREEKKIVINLPNFQIKSFFKARFFVFLLLFIFSISFVYWVRNIRPFLSISTAHINAYSTLLSCDAGGQIVEIGPVEGERVRKGDLLFSFDREFLLTKRALVKKKLDDLESQAEFENERMEKAMEGYLEAVNELEMGIGSSENLQKQLDMMELAQSKTEEILSKSTPIKTELSLLDLELKKGAIFAPFDGIILKRYKNEGAVISVGDPVYTLCDPSRIWVEAEIPETFLGKVDVGTSAKIWLSAYPNKEFNGKVSYIGSATVAKSEHLPFSQNRGAVPIKITLENEDFSLKPGLSAKIDLKVR